LTVVLDKLNVIIDRLIVISSGTVVMKIDSILGSSMELKFGRNVPRYINTMLECSIAHFVFSA
jgi:hypothetical protein